MKKIIGIIILITSLVGCGNQNNYQQQSYEMKNIKNTQVTTNIVGSFTTNLTDKTEGRLHNINLAISKLDGTVVKAGETFSFNDTIGPREEKDGYKEAIIFDGHGNKTKGFGGGVCQVTTTLYNAAKNAGLEIEERHEHSRDVPYIEDGADATVSFYGNEDLKFKNTKNYDIIINASATDDNVIVNIKR